MPAELRRQRCGTILHILRCPQRLAVARVGALSQRLKGTRLRRPYKASIIGQVIEPIGVPIYRVRTVLKSLSVLVCFGGRMFQLDTRQTRDGNFRLLQAYALVLGGGGQRNERPLSFRCHPATQLACLTRAPWNRLTLRLVGIFFFRSRYSPVTPSIEQGK